MSKRRKTRIEAKKLSLDKFWAKEKNGLFKDIKPKKKLQISSGSPAVQSLMKINDFYEINQREPSKEGPFEEKKLARALNKLRVLNDRSDTNDADIHGLLLVKHTKGEEITEVKDSETIENPKLKLDKTNNKTLASSILNLFGGGKHDKLFDTSKLKQGKLKNTQETYGKRTPCPDFHRYVTVFNKIKRMIDSREAVIEPFKRGNVINIGEVFIWDGITCFVAEELKMEHDAQGKPNPRLSVIFDNGTHANILKQSFSQGMYRSNGTRRISRKLGSLLDNLSKPIEERYGKKTGEIYFLASHSNSPEVLKYNNLIKIGVTENTTPLRTRNAETESTYLFSPIRILKIIPCYNMNVMGLEALIHTALNDFRKEIVLSNKRTGRTITAREWFDISVDKAESVAMEIVKGNYSGYSLDQSGNLHNEN
jgi:hypothetical protein